MTLRRRVAQLEDRLRPTSDDAGLCLRCQGPGSFRRMVDRARLELGAKGELFGVDPEECRAKLQGLPPRPLSGPEHCTRCGGLTPMGAIRAIRAERGLD